MRQRLAIVVALVMATLAPLLLFVVFEVQRPFPFSTTNDNWGYFLPLMTKTTNAWLDGHSLRVAWELGQGWSPWDSGQIGWLSPLPVVAALIARLVGDPLLLLEVNAGLHLFLLGLASLFAPPPRFSGWSRAAATFALGLAPGPILVGMNWHDYLTPAPWFLILLGLVWRAVDEDRSWSLSEGVVVVVVSLLFFSAAHPQMFVLGHGFLALFALAAAHTRHCALETVARLALAQLPALPALFYLMGAAAAGSPTWTGTRDSASLLTGALPPVDGLGAVFLGPWFADTAAAWFNPWLLLLIVVGVLKRARRVVVAALLMLLLLVPTLAPPIEHFFIGGLASFRFPVKLACYATPVAVALWFVLGARFHRWAAIVVAALGVGVCLLGNEAASTFNSAHALGARALVTLADRCLSEAGVAGGQRIAFVGDLQHSRSFEDTPLALMAVANNAPLLAGRSSTHLYEPLESGELAQAHGGLTAFWRGKQVRTDDEGRLQLLRRSGTDWLLSLTQEELQPLASTQVCGVWFTPFPQAQAFPADDVSIDSAGVLTTTTAAPTPPATDTARPLSWLQLNDGRWRATPPLPPKHWWLAEVCTLVLALVLVRQRLPARLQQR